MADAGEPRLNSGLGASSKPFADAASKARGLLSLLRTQVDRALHLVFHGSRPSSSISATSLIDIVLMTQPTRPLRHDPRRRIT